MNKPVLLLAEEVERMYFDYNCSFHEAMAKAKEMVANENIQEMEKAN
ncbi:hypothetical protein RBU61_08435 [Tissierella sp. MB52-C2]|nr:hypothetical protein [Tissierella sp. MB52-C2]WMM26692.1 hypothetical protein RBU61_08435 [Tissierella sp. MB52-C2]